MNPRLAASLLGVSADASLEEVKKSFREKAKALHPDTATATQTGDGGTTFAELREAYEILTNRAEESRTGNSDSIYGPGMRARFEAAKKWRERQGASSGPVRAARESTSPGNAGFAARGGGDSSVDGDGDGFGSRRAEGGASDGPSVEDDETLEAILRRHKAARSQPSDAARSGRTVASETRPFLTGKMKAHALGGSKIAGAVGAALLCTTSCLLYHLSCK